MRTLYSKLSDSATKLLSAASPSDEVKKLLQLCLFPNSMGRIEANPVSCSISQKKASTPFRYISLVIQLRKFLALKDRPVIFSNAWPIHKNRRRRIFLGRGFCVDAPPPPPTMNAGTPSGRQRPFPY